MTKCDACIQGPKGVEGHQGLFVSSMSGGPMQFRCRSCGALWLRSEHDKTFEWTDSMGSGTGAMVPRSAKDSA